MDYFLCVLGMVFIIEGLPYFLFPEKLKFYMLKIMELSPGTLRFLGLLAIIAGLIFIYFGCR